MKSNAVWGSIRGEGVAEGFADGMAKGLIEGHRACVQRLLQLRFPGQIPADILAFLKTTQEIDLLKRWFDAALMAATPQIFEQMVTRQ